MTWARAVDGHTMRAADYARSIIVVHRTGRAVARFFTRYDLLLSPTMCRPPHRLGILDMMTTDEQAFVDTLLSTIAFTSIFNSTGQPAMSVPLAWSRGGLPIGIQFAARFGDEATLFRLASQLEQAQPWAHRRPPMAQTVAAGAAGGQTAG
jgi:Asp-tRNA(Asn)/Glu-tRNA(Gln) amidotransferase A subunit family amidase